MNKERQALSDTKNFLSRLGLKKFTLNKLTLQSLLEINKANVYEEEVESLENIPWSFLRKLFKMSTECRSCSQLSKNTDADEGGDELSDLLITDDSEDSKINPLDLVVALFLCADNFLQQEMSSKLSMCQFPVPLLLPCGSKDQCTLMLWALRDIVKEWCPHNLSASKGFVRGSLVQTELPFYSFVRLRNCRLSKSQLLNQMLSLGHDNNNIFMHREMKGGKNERRLSIGLVEVCWYLPSGTRTLDIFPGPVGFANLRGDISGSVKQFTFLLQVSTATFVLLDKVQDDERRILTSVPDMRSKLFLVVNRSKETTRQDMMSVKTVMEELKLPKSRIKIKDAKENMAEFSDKLSSSIKKSLTSEVNTVVIENLVDRAVDVGLTVDETGSCDQREAAKKIVNEIPVQRIPHYKKKELPLQGNKWKRLSQLEMEECRLKKPGDRGLEEYKSVLQNEKKQIREELKHKRSTVMKQFIQHLSQRNKENRDFFLKWMKIHLNAHLQCDTQLSLLRSQLKEQSNKEEKDMKLLAELDQTLLDSSLGIEHYMREIGLIYEFSTSTTDKVTHLPKVAAEMLLDGHPLELLDGDASNIPQKWVTDVLMELHKRVGERSRLLVLTVLGVQSSGKSTLLNTMFGVQFPVSSGRCTRGAYMVFLRVGEDIKNDMNCDFIVLIDTEGLRSPLLENQEHSCEHDNQLATFVIGLSDVTIINIAMENSVEMQDVLQIATHAFLRMKKIGKKPVCHFVHQNVTAVSAHEKTLSERKHLLDQLNEMTTTAAEMENLANVKKFTDVLDYDIRKNNWNIPGLWYGTPPMAPVNTGYSEAVAEFKKHLLERMSENRDREVSQIPEFLMWIKSLWKAVKYENFLFSFRNTLVAHAYDNLCKEFSQWEWDFRRLIFSCEKAALEELEINKTDTESEDQRLIDLVEKKKSEISKQVTVQEKLMKQKLQDYYKRKNIHIYVIKKYKIHFFNSIGSITSEIRHSVNNKLKQVVQLKESPKEIQDILKAFREVIEEKVMKLVNDQRKSKLTDEELRDEFENTWSKETENLTGLKEQNICNNIIKVLKGSFLNQSIGSFFENFRDLKEIGDSTFEVGTEHIKEVGCLGCFGSSRQRSLQIVADDVIKSCREMLKEVTMKNTDYHECLTKDLLEKVDHCLKKHRAYYKLEFELELKLHICGIALGWFLKIQEKCLSDDNPQTQLKKFKSQYLSDFLYTYKLMTKNKTEEPNKECEFV